MNFDNFASWDSDNPIMEKPGAPSSGNSPGQTQPSLMPGEPGGPASLGSGPGGSMNRGQLPPPPIPSIPRPMLNDDSGPMQPGNAPASMMASGSIGGSLLSNPQSTSLGNPQSDGGHPSMFSGNPPSGAGNPFDNPHGGNPMMGQQGGNPMMGYPGQPQQQSQNYKFCPNGGNPHHQCNNYCLEKYGPNSRPAQSPVQNGGGDGRPRPLNAQRLPIFKVQNGVLFRLQQSRPFCVMRQQHQCGPMCPYLHINLGYIPVENKQSQ